MKRADQWELVAAVALHCAAHGITKTKKPVGNASSYRIADRLDKLARIARTLHRYYEFACNEDTAQHSCAACEGKLTKGHVYTQCFYAKVETLEKRAEDIGRELGIVVSTQRDPRGLSVKLWADREDGQQLGGF